MVPKSIQGSPTVPASNPMSEVQKSEIVVTKETDIASTSIAVDPGGDDPQAKASAMSKMSEAKLEADVRAADLNSQLNAQESNSSGFYDLLISSFKDPKTPETKSEGNGSVAPPPPKSLD